MVFPLLPLAGGFPWAEAHGRDQRVPRAEGWRASQTRTALSSGAWRSGQPAIQPGPIPRSAIDSRTAGVGRAQSLCGPG